MSTLTMSPPTPGPSGDALAAMLASTVSGSGNAAANGSTSSSSRRNTDRMTNRYSVNAIYSLAAEQDIEVQDALGRAQIALRNLKNRISAQSKRNFVLERDVRYLDSRIALLIQNRIAADEKRQVQETLDDTEEKTGNYPARRKLAQYSNLFFLLQSEPRHMAALCRQVSYADFDTLMQTVMFTLYGNQYDQREEHLLLTMFQSVLSAEFENNTEMGELLRANTAASRMMTTYTRRGPGQSYLKNVLAERINSLVEHEDLNLEINPLKVYEEMVTQIEADTGGLPPSLPRGVSQEVAANNPDVQAIIRPRITMLMEIADTFLTTIFDSIDTVPYGIRWICKQILSLTRRKYPEVTEAQICSLIGGFFFLRFLNPAIVTPQAYMLIESKGQHLGQPDQPPKNPRRTLTLIAKILQNLANKPSYSKEQFMIPLNSFVDNHQAMMNQFLNQLCEVGDFYESLEMDQYMALSKRDLSIDITLNELYGTHALFMHHLDTVSPNERQHLRVLLDDLGPAPDQVPRSENGTVHLPLYSRWETPIQDLSTTLMSESITQNDINFMETKSIFVQLLRAMPDAADRRPIDLPALAERAATSRDPVLVRRGIKVQNLLSELEAAGVLDRTDNYKLLQDEVRTELVHLGNAHEKVLLETRSLEEVFHAICDHNQYLRNQIDSYKAYLFNSRMMMSKDKGAGGVGVVSFNGKDKKARSQSLGPYRFTHQQLEKEGVVKSSAVPPGRHQDVYLNFWSPTPGTFLITLHFKGREQAIVEMDLKIDDLLERQDDKNASLDLEYISLYVVGVLELFNKLFTKRR
ncbi:GTPase-activating protein (Ras GTPase-activating protein) [Trichosporon asahii var. asahii CBS 2479]|uniref:GTPase-activating protein (Ras GTPase-activating protein) n=1 Tax=Trichosporon asahii var. asahii (strain ATCC 90039 / CBS 2479 / JCM 2466 / KCTC 7840 / NBRC 103889/ NCYC 2677 / UAMH 7654) TaxID=1186058 RepID=J6EPJ0_TRIAS|nr:GTPase-activating protein (Ras GTPase-activating protein) [Trichosporon asahii var. asahii CBS 2479]EJT46344.1 GTPase-activating protein (Ras GTPase-activating protein) [Trichosporon asahii var. asahii CBS 2479]